MTGWLAGLTLPLLLISQSSTEGLHGITWWMLGNTQVTSLPLLGVGATLIAVSIAGAWLLARSLNALTLGREMAHSMLCDCWGMSSPSIVPDIGVMASRDMVAIETATLKAIETRHFIPGSLIGNRRLMKGRHLLERIHGKDPFLQIRALERHGVGQSRYRLVEVK